MLCVPEHPSSCQHVLMHPTMSQLIPVQPSTSRDHPSTSQIIPVHPSGCPSSSQYILAHPSMYQLILAHPSSSQHIPAVLPCPCPQLSPPVPLGSGCTAGKVLIPKKSKAGMISSPNETCLAPGFRRHPTNPSWRARGEVDLNCPRILPPEALLALPASPPEPGELGLNSGRALGEHRAPSPEVWVQRDPCSRGARPSISRGTSGMRSLPASVLLALAFGLVRQSTGWKTSQLSLGFAVTGC